jgi:hypothetical protein
MKFDTLHFTEWFEKDKSTGFKFLDITPPPIPIQNDVNRSITGCR